MKLSRRDFIGHSGGTLFGLSLAAQAHAAEWSGAGKLRVPENSLGKGIQTPTWDYATPSLPPGERVGFALVGLGTLTLKELLPAFSECHLAKPTALVSGHPDKAAAVAKEYGIPASHVYSYENFEKIADNKDVQVVYVVLPNSMHRDFTERAFRAGKHVLCEKPMSVNAKDAEAMIAAGKKANRKLMIAYRQQYEPGNRWVRERLRDKTIGTPKFFQAVNAQNEPASYAPNLPNWRLSKKLAGGGPLPDIGLYCLNAARFLSGEEPFEVEALTSTNPDDPRFREVEELIDFRLKFPSGLVASCLSSYATFGSQSYAFVGDKGQIGMSPAFAYRGLKVNLTTLSDGQKYQTDATPPARNQFALEIDHMADCVRADKLPHTPGEEGLQDHRIMDAIYESAKRQRPVKLERIVTLDTFRHPTL